MATCTCGNHTVETETIKRDVVSIEIIVHTTQYVGKKTKCPCCGKEYMPKFPENVKNVLNYDEKIKSFMVFLNTYCNVPNRKVKEFFGFLSNGKIDMSPTTVLNTVNQFSKKSKGILKKIKKILLKKPVINEDETPIDVNGKQNSAIGIFTKDLTLIEAFVNRKLESFEEMGILDRYIGTVCHDHNNIHKSFIQSKQAECNFHILRYCKAEYEIHKRGSIKNVMNYLLELNEIVEREKAEGKTRVTVEEYEEYKRKYLKLLDAWDKEFTENVKNKNSKYYQSEKNLKARMREYADDHLIFLTDFRIDFTNNLAERGLRKIKGKLKVMGTFRSLESAKNYCGAISIIDTAIKQKLNIGNTIESIFKGQKKIFAF